ncbi:MAG: phosphoglycerate mutase [Sulfurimicrobium sp.]
MHCHLLIPALFPPGAVTRQNDPLHGLRAPALQTLLARASCTQEPCGEMESWLCEAFGAARQQDYPAAPLSLMADGLAPETYYWLRADPVHLDVERDQLVLSEASTFPLAQDEADALSATLNQHFGADGLHFVAPRAQRWYLRLARPPALATHGLYQAAGRAIRPLLPTGDEAMRWRALLNEAQMLLFEHPVNVAREARGIAPVNSVWLSGGGVLPQDLRQPFDQVWAGDALARGLAQAARIPGKNLPEDAAAWLKQATPGKHLLVLDALRAAACYGEPDVWRKQLARLEEAWFAPLKQTLQRGAITLTLHAPTPVGTLSFTLSRSKLWKLWQPVRPLARYRPQGI